MPVWALESGVRKRWWFPKGRFWNMFPCTENRNEGTLACSPDTKNRNERMFGCSPVPKIRPNHPFLKPPLIGKHPADHNHQDFLKSTVIQMGGILQYKWEACCDTNGRSTGSISLSLEPRGTKSTAIQIGGVLQYKWEVFCDTLLRNSGGWGFWHSSDYLFPL